MSDYYTEENLIMLLKDHIPSEEANGIDFHAVVEDGEVYPQDLNGVSGCYIYSIPGGDMPLTVFVHPTICVEVDYDAWTPKDVYMGRQQGEILW